jgi:predicted esterase YcpF (UPF0227 family)
MKLDKSCVIYHGLGSKPAESRTKMLNELGYVVISEQHNYHDEWEKDKGYSLFNRELKKINKVNLIIGISFGGYLAYQLSKSTGIDVILINAAIDRDKSKSVIKNFDIWYGNKQSNIELFFGENDTSVPKELALEYINAKKEDYTYHIISEMSHRISDRYFEEILKKSNLIRSFSKTRIFN